MTDDEKIARALVARLRLMKKDYLAVKPLPNGEYLGVQKMITTAGLFIIVDEYTWRTRYCYEHLHEAAKAYSEWDGVGDPPGPWIKQKPEERWGPGMLTPSREGQPDGTSSATDTSEA